MLCQALRYRLLSSVVFLTALFGSHCYASQFDASGDRAAITMLEEKALTAPMQERAMLYTQLAEQLALLAGQQIKSGEERQAEQTLMRMEQCTQQMQQQLSSNSKNLKQAELHLHDTERRMRDMVRLASSSMKPKVQTALLQLNAAQRSLLLLLFAK